MTDIVDWMSRGFALVFCLLLLWRALVLVLPAHVRETPLIVLWATLGSGIIWLLLLGYDWAYPVATSLYVTNGSGTSYDITIDGEAFCIPPSSYQHLTWRRSFPTQILAGRAGQTGRIRYQIGKGIWFVNVAPVPISADVINYSTVTAGWDAFGVSTQGSTKFTVSGGTPFRLFSESSADKLQAVNEEMTEQSLDGHCK
jgi:hypothetical protein